MVIVWASVGSRGEQGHSREHRREQIHFCSSIPAVASSTVARVSSLRRSTSLADALVDPLQDEIGDLQVVLVLHDHVAVAADAAVRRAEHLRLTAGRLEAADERLTALEGLCHEGRVAMPVGVSR